MFVCEKVHYTIDYYSYYRSRNIIKTISGKTLDSFLQLKYTFVNKM